jgi:hypothetical protein
MHAIYANGPGIIIRYNRIQQAFGGSTEAMSPTNFDLVFTGVDYTPACQPRGAPMAIAFMPSPVPPTPAFQAQLFQPTGTVGDIMIAGVFAGSNTLGNHDHARQVDTSAQHRRVAVWLQRQIWATGNGHHEGTHSRRGTTATTQGDCFLFGLHRVWQSHRCR